MDDYKKSLVEAIEIVVDNELAQTKYTSSMVGIVMSVSQSTATVQVADKFYSCKISLHLLTHVKIGSTVVVQDLYNDGVEKYILSVIR